MHANLTQEGLGERVDLDRRMIGFIESGAADPRLSWLLLIAAELGVRLVDLVAE